MPIPGQDRLNMLHEIIVTVTSIIFLVYTEAKCWNFCNLRTSLLYKWQDIDSEP
jgi:hypothetical protein